MTQTRPCDVIAGKWNAVGESPLLSFPYLLNFLTSALKGIHILTWQSFKGAKLVFCLHDAFKQDLATS